MASLKEIRAQYPQYDSMSDGELATALHSRFYSQLDKSDFFERIGYGAPSPDTGQIEEGVEAGTLRSKAETVGRVVTATGQALGNVPENLTIGRQGMALMGAERQEAVDRSDADAMGAGGQKLNAVRELIAQREAELASADRADRPTIEADLTDLRGLENQLGLLYDDAAAGVSRETTIADLAAEDVAAARARLAEAEGDLNKIDAEHGTPEFYIANAIGSAAESAPALFASVVMRSPAPMMAFIGVHSGGRAYASGREKGLTPNEAQGYATLTALAEGIPEALPISVMLKPGQQFLTRVVKGAAAESVQETITEALQVGIDREYISPDMTWGEARQRLIDAGITGGIAGGVMGGGVDVTQKGLGAIAKAAKPAKTEAQEIADKVLRRLNVPKPVETDATAAPAAAQETFLPQDTGQDVNGAPDAIPQVARNVLDFIGSHEAPRGYDQIFNGSAIDTPKPLTSMTLDEVLAWQDQSVAAGSASSAAGRFQFIRKTLRGLKANLGLSGQEQFTPELQDRLAVELMREKGLDDFLAGRLSVQEFGNRLSAVWAALPQVSGPNAGRGTYDGDGLNNAYADGGEFLSVLSGGAFSSISGEGGSGFRAGQAPQVAARADGGGSSEISSTSQDAAPLTEDTLPEPSIPEVSVAEVAAPEAEATAAPQTPQDAETAAQVESQAAQTEAQPTEGQKEAGNYKKGHVKVRGFDVTIENAKGSERSGVDGDGKAWSVEMPAHYGYLKRTKGADGDHVDVYLGENLETGKIGIVDQVDADTGKFDEHKVIMGVASMDEAAALYDRGFNDGRGADRLAALTEVTPEGLREWLDKGSQNKPYSGAGPLPGSQRKAAPDFMDVVGDLRKATGTDMEAAELGRKLARKVGAKVDKSETAKAVFDRLDPAQQIDMAALAKAATMPNERSAPKKRSKRATKPFKELRVKRSEIELSRKTAIQKLKDAIPEIEEKMRLDQDTLTEVTITTPSGGKTTFRFMPTASGVDAAHRVIKQWKAKPANVLQLQAPSAMAEGLHFDEPMPNHQPLWRNMETPARSDVIEVAGEVVQLPPEHKPVRREAIRTYVEGIIGQRIYQGRVRGKTTLGFYRQKNGEMRLSKFDDVEVLAHEIAHWMDFNTAMDGRFNRMRKKAPGTAQDEMRKLSYTSKPALVNKEGFAEYVRLWLTQYETAKKQAPEFTKAFEAELAVDKKFQKRMERLRREMHKYFRQGALAQARGNIGEDQTAAQVTRKFVQNRPIERMRQQAIDRLHGIKVAEREASGTISEGEMSAYKLMQMVNGAGSLYDTVIADGTPQLTADGIERRGKSLDEVFAPLYKQGARAFDDFLTYAAGRRAKELKAQDRENLFSSDQIDAMLKLKRPGFDQVFADFQTFNGELLDFYVDMGLITKDQRKAFSSINQNYMPFHRVAEELETGKSSGRSASSIGARLQGGDRNVRDLADNIVDGIMTNVRQAMIARAKRQLYLTLSSSDTGAAFAAKINTDSKKVQAHVDEMAGKVASVMARLGFGISSDGILLAPGAKGGVTDQAEIVAVLKDHPEVLQFWQHNLPPQTSGTLVDSAIIGGKVQYFEVQDPVLIESLMGQEMLELGVLYDGGVAVKNTVTRLITSMPPFLIPNIVRDTVSASTLSDSGFRPVLDSVKGLGHIVTKSKTYRTWQRNGGGYSSLVQATTQRKGRGTQALAVPADWRHPGTILSKTLASWDAVAALFENATRVGEFKRALEKGKTTTEAAYRAREISTDFAKRPGNVGWTAVLRMTAFMNAALQGNDRLLKAFVGEDGRIDRARLAAVGSTAATRLFLRVGSAMAGFTALLWYMQHDDERYKALTPDQKSRFWHIFLPGEFGSIQIPKPYGVGFIFADLVENALDHVAKVDGATPAKNLAWAAGHHFWFMDYPTFLQPGIDAMRNKTFTGSPVVPVFMQDLSPENQYRSTTPEIYKRLGDAAGMSPMRLQHYSRGFLGYLETAFSDTTEFLLWDEDAFGPRPFPRGVDDYLFKQFKGAPFPYRTKYTEQYYELRQRARTAAADLRKVSEDTRRPERLQKLAKDKVALTLAELNNSFATIDRELSAMRTGVDAIKYDKTKSKEAKERLIENLYRARNDVLRKTYSAVQGTIEKLEKEQKQ